MNLRRATQISILLLAVPGLACSMLRGTQPLSWHVTLEVDRSVQDLQGETKRAVTVIESRLNALGLPSYEVKALGTPLNGRILVSLPTVSDRERLKKLITTEGRLELNHVISRPSPAPVQVYQSKEQALAGLGGSLPANRRVVPYSDIDKKAGGPKGWVVVEASPIVADSDLRSAAAVPIHSGSDDYTIEFSLGTDGAQRFGKWTSENINEYLAVIYDGEVKSTAFIKSQISDRGEIAGRFTKQTAEDIALILKSGALAPVTIIEEG